MRISEESINHLTDVELEQRLESLTFTISLETTHFHAFSDHRRMHIMKNLLVNKQILCALREERERRIIAGRYRPF